MTYTFSIIIPHKNIPTLLERCLASIPQREDLEIIIVDDNSDPNIVDFEHFPGKDRSNSTVIFDKSGKGAGRARNIGLQSATGRWILFSDADDVFTEDFADILLRTKNNEAEIIFYQVESRDTLSLKPGTETQSINDAIQHALTKYADLSYIKFKNDAPWGKIFKQSFIKEHSICFQEVPCANDARFSALCDFYAKCIDIVPIYGYCYMTRQDSLWHTQSLKGFETRFRVCMGIYRFMVSHKRKDYAKLYNDRGLYFLSLVSNFSKKHYLKNYILYGFYTQSLRIVLWRVPKLFIQYAIVAIKNN